MTILRLHPIVLGLYLVIAAVGIGVVISGYSESSTDRPRRQRDVPTLELIVKSAGAETGSVAYVTPGSIPLNVSRHVDVRLPWNQSFRFDDELQAGFNLVAQQRGGGKLTCLIKRHGKVIAEDSDQGRGARVRCAPR